MRFVCRPFNICDLYVVQIQRDPLKVSGEADAADKELAEDELKYMHIVSMSKEHNLR